MLPHTKSYLMYVRLIKHWLPFVNIEPHGKFWGIMKICEANFEIIIILNDVSNKRRNKLKNSLVVMTL
jgi:hypothetical protein